MADCGSPPIDGVYKTSFSPRMNKPHDIISHLGHYIVTDTHNHRVIAVNAGDGSAEELCGGRPNISEIQNIRPMKPYGIVALSSTERNFLITDINNACILQFKDGKVSLWNRPGDVASGLRHPNGIAVDKKGNIYVADSDCKCIFVFDIEGVLSRSFGLGHLKFPWFLKFDSTGNLYVTDDDDGFKVFDATSNFIKQLQPQVDNRSWVCRGITIDQYDNIFITVREKGALKPFSRERMVIYDKGHNPVFNLGGFMHFNFIRGLCVEYERNEMVIVNGERHKLDVYKLYESRRAANPIQQDDNLSLSINVSPSQEVSDDDGGPPVTSHIGYDDDGHVGD